MHVMKNRTFSSVTHLHWHFAKNFAKFQKNRTPAWVFCRSVNEWNLHLMLLTLNVLRHLRCALQMYMLTMTCYVNFLWLRFFFHLTSQCYLPLFNFFAYSQSFSLNLRIFTPGDFAFALFTVITQFIQKEDGYFAFCGNCFVNAPIYH